MENFTRLCKTNELKNKVGKKFVLEDDSEIAVFKVDEKFYAVTNTCPHNQSKVMFEGIVDDDLYLNCPIHCYKFSLETGKTPESNPEMSGKLKIYNTKIVNDELWIEKKKKLFFTW